MIIFGFRTAVKLLAMVNLVCRNCGNPAAQRVQKQTRWFTLFFIPVIPFGGPRTMTCTFCGLTTRLSAEDADHLERSASMGQHGGPPQPAAPYGQQYGQPQPGYGPQGPQQGGPNLR